MARAFRCHQAILLVLSLLAALVSSKYDPAGAAKWALGCVDNCAECTCKSGGGGANPGYCKTTADCDVKTCSCGCTPFVSTAMTLGGGWNGPFETVCVNFWSYVKGNSHWNEVSTIAPGDLVVMQPDGEGPAGHCCIGTGVGTVSCHNKALRDSPPQHKVNGIYRHVSSEAGAAAVNGGNYSQVEA